ncbi:methyl-accepting chemotaxis protein [Desulfonatronum thiosulfatophilum]|uniref:Methyl-accepting chemotaxis protein n=1 Tax=Desulfonatronum thiosulfatophilum TaxID=617002 RepID=A0A1G6BAF8_9BACT|nr:methyl-accepting chemotaxis protein [Desulfonatronum thiosulfatophilum]SDB17642.1 methyl-accepting chemotaxis protein [Desulfonatronum thiosulfatophilum]
MKVSIFGKLIGVVVLAVLLTSSVLFFTTNHYVAKGFDEKALEELNGFQGAVRAQIEDWEELLEAVGFLMSSNFEVQHALQQNDTQMLKEFARDVMQQTGVDFLTISDRNGVVVARGHSQRTGDSVANQVNVQRALKGESSVGIEHGTEVKFSVRAGFPVKMGDRILGVVTPGFNLGSFAFVDDVKRRFGVEATIFEGDTRLATTIMRDGQRVVGTRMDNQQVLSTVLQQRQTYFDRNMILGQNYDTAYWPIINSRGEVSGMFFIGVPRNVVEEAQNNILMSILLVSLVVGGVMIAVGILFARSLALPIRNATAFATQVAQGNLDEQLEVKNKDEIGILAGALKTMVGNLKIKIQEADEKAREAALAAQQAREATEEAMQAKEQAENAKREGMLQAAGQLEGVIEQMTSASEQLAAQVEQASRGSEEQRARTGETATAMEEMNATVLEVAKNASQAAEASDQSRTKAEDGAKVVTASVAAINKVQQQAAEMKNNLNQLGQQAEQIGRIMNVIEDIADQTNLLALNAAIEAARAGDAGRGFAVVADEVRKLAEKTMNATKEVGQAISAIQQGTKANIQGMDQSVHAIEQATDLANQSGQALKEILALAEQAADQVRSIATAAEEQSATSEEINRGVEDINRIASETNEVMSQSAQAVSDLARQSQDLQNLVRQMKDS